MTTVEELAAPLDAELLVIVGETASGKSALALELAERFDGEIVGADSVQIYRHFDLGSGKPSAGERARCPHHLIDIAEPDEPLDAARFVALADAAIAAIRQRGRRAIVCGGTFLWIKALLYGLAPAPPADPELRLRHQQFAEEHGRAALHARLAAIDADSAARLAPNDLIRVSRALEVYELSGKTMTRWQAEHAFQQQRYPVRLLRLRRERSWQDERIAARARDWLERGWVQEVEQLIERGYGDCRAMKSVGYRQLADHLRGELAASDLHEAVVRATRTFARRQRTWLRDLDLIWIEPG